MAIREPWSGKVTRQIEITCYDCPFQNTFHNTDEARRDGWRRIDGFWKCPRCVVEAKKGDC